MGDVRYITGEMLYKMHRLKRQRIVNRKRPWTGWVLLTLVAIWTYLIIKF